MKLLEAGLLILFLFVGGVNGQTVPAYQRALYLPHGWIDADKDCQDARAEVLIRDSLAPVTFRGLRRCVVATGRWRDPYTGIVYLEASEVEIDHRVALDRAHEDGAWAWPPERKSAFANDLDYPGHLVAVGITVNRAKGAKGPETWKPPLQSGWCRYAESWSAIKASWGLSIRPAEQAALREMLQTC